MGITAKELAQKLNLSEAAISMALNNKPGVSTKTRKKIIEEAKKYGYDFTRIKEKELPSQEQGTICFIVYRKNGALVPNSPILIHEDHGSSVPDTPFWGLSTIPRPAAVGPILSPPQQPAAWRCRWMGRATRSRVEIRWARLPRNTACTT